MEIKKELKELVKKLSIVTNIAEKKLILRQLMKASQRDNIAKDLPKIREEIDKLKYELIMLNKVISETRTTEQNLRIRELTNIIPKAELRYSLDKAELRNRQAGYRIVKNESGYTAMKTQRPKDSSLIEKRIAEHKNSIKSIKPSYNKANLSKHKIILYK